MKTDKINQNIKEFNELKEQPLDLYYRGNLELLKRPKISIVGTRRPNSYTKEFTYKLSSKLSEINYCTVSGAAMGVDIIAFSGAKPDNCISVMANGLDIKYPAVNKDFITQIENQGLVLSEYKDGQKARNYTFVKRNRLVVALGEVLVVTQADLDSGSLRSVEYAQELDKEIYVLPHRLNESLGTQNLIKNNQAKVIYDIDEFLSSLKYYNLQDIADIDDEFLEYCRVNTNYEEVCSKYAQEVFEYELNGKIEIVNGVIKVV
jgi:DNA processing protein